MILFPNCKINFGLYITGKRPDGYHNLQTVFYPVALRDVLEIISLPSGSQTTLSLSGMAIENNADNSCIKAYELLKKFHPQLPPVSIQLHKAIPAGGGLGGGSADAAFTLLLLNKKFNLAIDNKTLLQHALQLGSDCPFFITNKPSLATGRGEILKPVALDLSNYKIVLVNPGIHINTGWAFTQIKVEEPENNLAQIVTQPVAEWKDGLKNVFEKPIFETYPEIRNIKESLYHHGAVYASMTGSGATVYGLFKKSDTFSVSFPPHYLVKECYLAA